MGGRLRKVWKQEPAVFSRFYHDAERRETDFLHRFDDELLNVPVVAPEEANKIYGRLYEDAWTRESQRHLAVEAAWDQAMRDANGKVSEFRTPDPEHLERLTQNTVQKFRKQKLEEEEAAR